MNKNHERARLAESPSRESFPNRLSRSVTSPQQPGAALILSARSLLVQSERDFGRYRFRFAALSCP